MKIAVWRTGHEIADTVAEAVKDGLSGKVWRYGTTQYGPTAEPFLYNPDVYIAYGILRGTAEIFKEGNKRGKPWFNIDRAYWKPGHYDGYYRISLCGTQQVTGLDKLAPDYDRWRALGIKLKPWRGFDESKPVLVCPPTEHVWKFFDIPHQHAWMAGMQFIPSHNMQFREKGDPTPINFDDYNYVLTFNSSVGWQALAAGIPCVSDAVHSIVGAYFHNILLKNLSEAQRVGREHLFGVMSANQLTLDEMRKGKLWPLLNHLLSTSDTMTAKPPALTLPLTASPGVPAPS